MSQTSDSQTETSAANDRRWRLREATASEHEGVDAIFSRFSLKDRDGYGAFLLAQASAFFPVEASIEQSGTLAALTDWPDRRRAEFLREDIAALGLSPPTPPDFYPFKTYPALLGGIYVLEGSRLGGRLLARSVDPSWPQRFLSSNDPALWRRLLAIIERELVSEADLQEAIDSARRVFGAFTKAAIQRAPIEKGR